MKLDLTEVLLRSRPMQSAYERNPLAQELDQVGAGLRTFGEMFLRVIMLLATIFIVFFFVKLPHDSNRQFMQIYFGIGYLFVMGWALGQISRMKREKRAIQRRLSILPMGAILDPAPLDPAVLENAALHLNAGEPLDAVCAYTNSQYTTWPAPQRLAYAQWLSAQLADKTDQPISAAAMPAATQSVLGLTPGQIVVILIAFTLALAGFTTFFFNARISRQLP